MINYLLKKFSNLDFSNGNIVADKSSKFDTLFFVCKFLGNYISNDCLYLDLSDNKKDEITKQIVEVFNKNEDSSGNNNYLSEVLNYLQKIGVIDKENTDKYRIIDDEILQFITTSIENAYICQYISIYDAFVNNDLWNDYIKYTKISIDDENKHTALINMSNKISDKSPTITDNSSQWAYQTTMYYLEILGLANDEYAISRNLTIKSDKLNSKDLSANVKGTRSIGEKNDFYLHEFQLKYVKKMLENILVSCCFTIPSQYKRNRIVFGAPGTGKSFKLNIEKRELLGDNEDQYERVTFHPDYTYANFVGTYKPVMIVNDSNPNLSENDKKIIDILKTPHLNAQDKYDRIDEMNIVDTKGELNYLVSLCTEDGDEFKQRKEDGTQQQRTAETNVCRKIKKYFQLIDESSNDSIISYEYVPGPFMRLFVKALKNPDKPYLLLIEEINRANVAAVFGDLFQLLDRDDNEESMYPVEAGEDIKKFLSKSGIELEDNKIRIPNNLFIWATMNSADQGVFPMDTAFKRRWDFDYISINNNEESIKNKEFKIDIENKNGKVIGSPLNWNLIRKSINKYLSEKKINEDKQLGAYFISKKILSANNNKDFIDTFKNKVLMYLFEDAAKQKRTDIFAGASSKGYDSNRYSSICECFDEYGIECFNTSIQKDYIEKIAEKGYN